MNETRPKRKSKYYIIILLSEDIVIIIVMMAGLKVALEKVKDKDPAEICILIYLFLPLPFAEPRYKTSVET